MKTGNIILEVTQGLDVELGQLRWMTVKRIVEKHIEEARKELLRAAATEREILVNMDLTAGELGAKIHKRFERRLKDRKNQVTFHRLPI